jgi:hypothetical protein
MVEQEKILSHTLDEWMNDHTQVDDILVMGIQIGQTIPTVQVETF